MKNKIVQQLIEKMAKDLEHLKEALQTAKGLAQSEEFKAESKWDTRSIEAGYLAGAQEKRVKELEGELTQLKNLNLDKKETITPGALVTTEDKLYFITLGTGGHKIKMPQGIVHIISLHSPLGQKLVDEEIEIIQCE